MDDQDLLESVAQYLQECVNEGQINAKYANEILEFAIDDMEENDYGSKVIRLEDVVETCIEKLGIEEEELNVLAESDVEDVIDYLEDVVFEAYDDGYLTDYETIIMLDHLALENYDENLIFIEKPDETDIIDGEDDNHWRDTGAKIKDGFNSALAAADVHKNNVKRTVSSALNDPGDRIRDAMTRDIRSTKDFRNAVNDTRAAGIDLGIKSLKDAKKEAKDERTKSEIKHTKKEIEKRQATPSDERKLMKKIDKIESEIARNKERLATTDDDDESKKISAELTNLFAKLKETKKELKDAKKNNKKNS